MKLEGKVAIVTGAAGGIGQEIVRVFVEQGASVLAVDLDQAQADELAARYDGQVKGLAVDVTDFAQVEQMVDVEHGEDRKKGMLSIIPMGRFGTANEVAEAMVWLTSDLNSFMTGQAIILDGGLMAG